MKLWRYGRVLESLGKRYRLDEVIGSGGMADVCLAWDELESRHVAVKVIKSDELEQKTLDRFLKEASHIAAWEHPNILRLYSDLKLELVDAASGSIVPYIVMEYAQGGDLQKRLQPAVPYPLADALAIFSQLCNAVVYAHEQGVIHRDLKPMNVLFRVRADSSEQVVLSDFGLAVQTSATQQTFARAGTLFYMAPEQIQGKAQPASDIFALGVMLYQLCTGWLPFQRSLEDLRISEMERIPKRPSSLESSLPIELDDVLLVALAADPGQRFTSAALFWEAVCAAVPDAREVAAQRAQGYIFPGRSQGYAGLPQAEGARSGKEILPDVKRVHNPSKGMELAQNTPSIAYPALSRGARPLSARIYLGASLQQSGTLPSVIKPDRALTQEAPNVQQGAGNARPDAVQLQRDALKYSPGSLNGSQVSGAYAKLFTDFSRGNSLSNLQAMPRALPAPSQSPKVADVAEMQTLPPLPQPEPFISFNNQKALDALAYTADVPTIPERPAAFAESVRGRYATSDRLTSIPKRHRPKSKLVIGSIVLLLVLLSVSAVFASYLGQHNPLLPSGSASLTITPTSRTVTNSYVITAVMANPDAALHQIQGHVLASEVPLATTSKTVNGTGHNQAPAVAAQGFLIFFNTTGQQLTVAGGTVLRGMDGITVAPVANVSIPPTMNGITGQVTVAAQATNAGAAGNIPAQDLNMTCCRADGTISVFNQAAFTGGQDAKNYQFVQQGDVDTVVQPLLGPLNQAASAKLQQQGSMTGVQCNPNVDKSGPVGDTGQNVASLVVTISETCTGVTYDQQAMQTMVTTLLQDQATKDTGGGYALQDTVKVSLHGQDFNADKSVALQVNASGTWLYQWSNAQQQALAKMIAGKSTTDAKKLLEQQAGIQVLSIQGDTFARDPNQVKIIVRPPEHPAGT